MPQDKPPLDFIFPHIFIVEASAGSGKTYRLAKRYLQLLFNCFLANQRFSFEEILAITFTNKAAQEMKLRIMEFLKRLALDDFQRPGQKTDILSSLGLSQQEAKGIALKAVDYLIQNFNSFQVQTIDSFINAILTACSFRLGLSSKFEMKKGYRQYLGYSLDTVIAAAEQDDSLAAVLENFLKQYLFLENRHSWRPREDIFNVVTTLFLKENLYPADFIRSDIEPTDVIALKKRILGLMKDLGESIPAEALNQRFSDSLQRFLDENRNGFDLDSVSSYFFHTSPPVKKGFSWNRSSQQIWDEIRRQLKKLSLSESFSIYNYYIDIYKRTLDEFEQRLRRCNVIFLETLNKKARRIFLEQGLGLPELYYRLALRFRHFLLDEFQDTSLLQWENIFAMVEDALSRDGSIFYVGDKKQAIYRFRAGEAFLIDRVRAQFKGTTILQESLIQNYRSAKVIVDFNNRIFSPENLGRFIQQLGHKRKDGEEFLDTQLDSVLEVFKEAAQEAVKEDVLGYVRLERLGCEDKDERQQVLRDKVLSLLKDAFNRFWPSEIAILVRKNDEVEQLSSWLLQDGIAVESDKTLSIRNNPYIKELISFLSFLNSPIDNLSFASFILGEIFSRTSGLSSQQIRDFIFDSLKKDKNIYLYRVFRQEFPHIWDKLLEGFFRSVGFVPFYELVVSILARFRCFQEFCEYQGFFVRLLELIKEQEKENPTIGGFLEFFKQASDDELFVSSQQGSAVKIMTIHKAKGLEFPCVILPNLQMDIKVDTQTTILGEKGLQLIHLKKRYTQLSDELKKVWQLEYQNAFIDELACLYVALTRAIEELYVFVSERLSYRSFNPASLLFPDSDLEMGKKRPSLAKDNPISAAIELPCPEYKEWIPLLKNEWQGVISWEARQRIVRGEILHYILSEIGNTFGQDKGALLKRAVSKAKDRFLYNEEEFVGCQEVITALLNDARLLPYFELRQGSVFTEKEIVNPFGDTLRVDRLVVFPTEVVVLDYKSSQTDIRFDRRQVEGYLEVLRGLYPNFKIKGILVYLDNLGIEEVF